MPFANKTTPILVFIGPSGSGKSTIADLLDMEHVVAINPTYTTRPERKTDKQDRTHVIVSEEKFSKLKEDGIFLQTEKLFGLPYEYGFAKINESGDKRVPLVMLRAELIKYLPNFYTNFKVYQIEADLDVIKERLKERGSAHLGDRLKIFRDEVELGRQLANRIFINNHVLKTVYEEIKTAVMEDFA